MSCQSTINNYNIIMIVIIVYIIMVHNNNNNNNHHLNISCYCVLLFSISSYCSSLRLDLTLFRCFSVSVACFNEGVQGQELQGGSGGFIGDSCWWWAVRFRDQVIKGDLFWKCI